MNTREVLTIDLRDVRAYVETRHDASGEIEHVLVIRDEETVIELIGGIPDVSDGSREGAKRIADAGWSYAGITGPTRARPAVGKEGVR